MNGRTNPLNDHIISLTGRLIALTSDLKVTQSLVTRLSKFPSQLGSTPLDATDQNDTRVELGNEIHQSLKDHEEAFELLKQDVEDLPATGGGSSRREHRRSATGEAGNERARLEVDVKRFEEDLKTTHTQFRRAQLTAKRAGEAARKKERDLLFASVDQSEGGTARRKHRGKQDLSQDELLANASSDVTAALRRTHQLMSSELSRSQFAQDTLEQSTAALTSLTTHYSSLDTLLSTSRNLLGTLLRSQKSDTWYLESAFYVLLGTIVWLIFRRFFYGPLWWLVWLPLKYFVQFFSWVAISIFGFGPAPPDSVGPSNTRKPLIVKPSATDGPARVNWKDMGNGQESAPRIVVGGGGKSGGEMSERVAKMADEANNREARTEKGQNGADQKADESQQQEEQQNERDAPPNPKKRMWEEPVAEDRPKDEL